MEAIQTLLVLCFVGFCVWALLEARDRWGKPRSKGRAGKSFPQHVAGVSHRNADGSDRQEIIRDHCRANTALHLLAKPENQFSKHAVAVFVPGADALQIGFLPEETSSQVFRHLTAGGAANATISELTGGTVSKPVRGVNIVVTLFESGSAKAKSICVECYELNNGKSLTKGSFGIEVLLWVCFLVPGFIYSIWRLTTRELVCANCEGKLVPANSARGRAILKQTQ